MRRGRPTRTGTRAGGARSRRWWRSTVPTTTRYAALAALLGGCPHRSPEATATPQPATTPAALAAPAPASPVPSFRRDVLPVLVRNCASAKGCHGEDPTESVSLDLRPLGAY